MEVFSQIFIEREYSCFDNVENAQLIIDLGANVGYSAAYFLSRYPHATVIAVEPDPDNYDLLKRNIEPYGPRAIAVHAAVWPEDTTVRLDEASLGRSKEWGRRVVTGSAPGQGIRALSMASLLRLAPSPEISILKVDIEGAEQQLFGRNCEWWLGKVQNLCIELHGVECEDIFNAAVSGHSFEFSRSGELTVCRRRVH